LDVGLIIESEAQVSSCSGKLATGNQVFLRLEIFPRITPMTRMKKSSDQVSIAVATSPQT
jgi:hypothetical protein